MSNRGPSAEEFWGGSLVVYGPGRGPQPSENFARLLRGIATHLIRNDPRAENRAIPPDTMVDFYREQKHTGEQVDWPKYFRRSRPNISSLYRDLECEHLNMSHECIPALTPSGFETWMFARFMAFPGNEYKRINQILSSWSIIDINSGLPFPGPIPSNCSPKEPDLVIRKYVQLAQKHWP